MDCIGERFLPTRNAPFLQQAKVCPKEVQNTARYNLWNNLKE